MPSAALRELGSQRQVLAALLIVAVVTPRRETTLAHFLHTVWQALAMMVQMEVSTTKYLLVDLPGKHPPPSCHCPPLLPGLHACVPRKVRAQSLLSSLKPRVLAGDQTGSGGGQLPATRTASANDSFGIGTGVF